MVSRKTSTAFFFILFVISAIVGRAVSQTSVSPDLSPGANGNVKTEKFDITREKISELHKVFSETQGVTEEELARYDKISNRIINDLDQINKLILLKEEYIQLQKSAQSDYVELERNLENFQDYHPGFERVNGAYVSDAESTLSQFQTEYSNAKKASSELENEPQRRAKRVTEIPELISKYQEELVALNQEISTNTGESFENKIHHIELLKNKVNAELNLKFIDALQQEMKMYEATRNLLPLERDLAAKKLNNLQQRVDFWQETVNKLRKDKLEEIKQEAQTTTQQVKHSNQAARNIAKEINQLAQFQSELLTMIESTSEYQQSISSKLKDLKDDYLNTEELISKSEKVTSTMGMLLLAKKESLPETKQNIKNIKQRFELISTAQLQWRDYDKKWSGLFDIKKKAADMLKESGIDSSTPEFSDYFEETRSFLNQKRKILSIISGYYIDYFTLLAQLDAQERDLVDVVEQYNLFINKNLLWVKSGSSFDKDEFSNSLAAIKSIYTGKSLNRLWMPLSKDIKNNYIGYSLCLILAASIIAMRKWFIKKIRSYSDKTRRTGTDQFSHTLNTMLLSTAASLPAVVLSAFFTWRYSLAAAISNDLTSILSALKTITAITFIFFLLRWYTIDGGLGSHLKFDKRVLSAFRKHIIWLYMVVISIILMYGLLHGSDIQIEAKNAGLRFLFIIEQAAISIFLMILFNPASDAAICLQEFHTGRTVKHLRYFWFFLIISIPFTFSLISIIGYRHAALHLNYRLTETFFFYLAVLFFNRMLMRGLYISRRKLALKKIAEKKEIQTSHENNPEMFPATVRIDQINDSVLNISKQTRQIINVTTALIVVAGIWWIWKSTLPALEAFEKIQLGKTFDKNGNAIIISLGSTIKAVAIIILTIFTARNIPGLLEITVLQRLRFNSGARFAFTSLSKYLICAIGIIYSFSILGIKWATVQWLVAAVTVGLGFGLQEIFANFISGLIILFEQPIRVGDFVTIGDISGEVTQIKIRATTIVKWDRKELLVPNKEFITGRLVNWTLTDQVLRLEFPVGIAYGSDIKKAEDILYGIAGKSKQAIKDDPKPRVIFKGFGSSSLDFELRVYIADIKDYIDLWHTINCEIDTEFRKNGIKIAFPQRDMHIKSIDFDVTVPAGKHELKNNIVDSGLETSE